MVSGACGFIQDAVTIFEQGYGSGGGGGLLSVASQWDSKNSNGNVFNGMHSHIPGGAQQNLPSDCII